MLPATRTVQSSFTVGLGALDVFASLHCYNSTTSLLCQGFCKVCRLHARNSQSCASPSGGTGKGRNPPAGEKPARRRRTSLTGAGLPTYANGADRATGGRGAQKPAHAGEGSGAEPATPASRARRRSGRSAAGAGAGGRHGTKLRRGGLAIYAATRYLLT